MKRKVRLRRRRIASLGENVHFYEVSGEWIDGTIISVSGTSYGFSIERNFDTEEYARNNFISANLLLPRYIPSGFEISEIQQWIILGGWGEDGRETHEIEIVRDWNSIGESLGWGDELRRMRPLVRTENRSINMEQMCIVWS